ncbi:hypothetical protein lerEdw1_005215 [Lerista edwardsae]|nr:hypothetical protein lerEdw1_005215 [Lerista edwardsae]
MEKGKENPRTLRMLLHQKDLEIKGLKNAARRDPSDRLSNILHEIVKPKSKQIPKRRPTEDSIQKEDVNAQLESLKASHIKEVKQLEDKLIKSQLLVRHLEEAVKTLSMKSDDETETESSSSLDEGTQLARESFELWSESGTRILAEPSDLKLRRIPKHTSFVDAFHKFGSVSISDEEKDEILSHLESHLADTQPGPLLAQDSSEESLKTESKSEQSSLALLISQKSDLTSTDTKVSQSTWSYTMPSVAEKISPSYSADMGYSLDTWSYVTRQPTLEQPSDASMMWLPADHGTSFSFTEERKRYQSAIGSLDIVSVHSKGKFVRILNTMLNKEVDLSGYIIQQWVGGFPVSIYRFPIGTMLPPQHHLTVWAAGANLAHKQQPPGTIDVQKFFRAGPDCTTILYDRNGQTVSQYVAPHRFSAVAEAYSDNVDLSVDKFPLTEEEEEPDEPLPTRLERRLSPARGETKCPSEIVIHRRQRLLSIDSSGSKMGNGRAIAAKKKDSSTSSESSVSSSISTRSLPPIPAKESRSSISQEGYFASQTWQPLIDRPKARMFKTTLDTTLPMVGLIGQKSARSKYGFKYMTYIPITTDLPLRRYCPAK